ncbi:MAG: alpha/beta hydrolase [Lachnospiraceae bacterium]|nr:alpha/beta hydrolase [Lachnospiraceae bacterium]
MFKKEELNLVTEWDKTFPKSDKVEHSKVTFVNRYGITLAADMYMPKEREGKLPGVAVSGPFGAVKEQCSGLYAQTLAERGFLTIAFDPSFTGESGGNVRYMASPDINTEDFMAAVDFLSLNENVDPDRVGILGICGWGGMALNAAALDTRVKATVASTMYDMTRVNEKGYFDSEDSEEARYQHRAAMCAQRLEDLKAGEYKLGGGVVDPLPEDAPFFVKDYYDYYKTERGYHKRSLNSNGGWNVIGCESFMNQPILKYTNEIRNAVLIIHGEKAHSCYFSRDAYAAMTEGSKYADNKELMIIPGMVHTDLYDGGGKNAIPFDKIESFCRENLK